MTFLEFYRKTAFKSLTVRIENKLGLIGETFYFGRGWNGNREGVFFFVSDKYLWFNDTDNLQDSGYKFILFEKKPILIEDIE